jgi:hypothetical protein
MTMLRVVCLLAIAATGCLQSFAPDVGPLATSCSGSACGDAAGGCSNADSDAAASVSFAADILGGVFKRGGCTKCHTGDGMGIQQSGLSLASYASLRTGGGRSGANIVIDFKPCTSILAEKINTAPPFGRRMPYNGPPYLSAADITLVQDWIAEGARDN